MFLFLHHTLAVSWGAWRFVAGAFISRCFLYYPSNLACLINLLKYRRTCVVLPQVCWTTGSQTIPYVIVHFTVYFIAYLIELFALSLSFSLFCIF